MAALPPDIFELRRGDVERRFRWAREQGRPAFPWPGVAPAAWRACLIEMEGLVGRAMTVPGETVTFAPPSGIDIETVSVAAFTSGLGPLMGLWVEEGRLLTPEPVAELLALHLAHGRRRATTLRDAMRDAVARLTAAGLPVTVLKGLHTAHAHFPEPGVRPAADVDLLLPAGTLPQAGRILAEAGYRAGAAQRRPDKADWIPPGTSDHPRSLHLAHGDDPATIELHDSLSQDFFGVRTVTVTPPPDLPGCPTVDPRVTVLPSPELGAYLALHTAREIHRVQILKLVELALVLRPREGTTRPWPGGVARVLRAADGLRFALPALHLTDMLIPGSVEPGLMAEARRDAPARMLRYLAGLRPATAQRLEGVALDERFIWSSGPTEWARRALSLVWPRRARGSARPPFQTLGERLLGLVRGRVRLRASPPDKAAS